MSGTASYKLPPKKETSASAPPLPKIPQKPPPPKQSPAIGKDNKQTLSPKQPLPTNKDVKPQTFLPKQLPKDKPKSLPPTPATKPSIQKTSSKSTSFGSSYASPTQTSKSASPTQTSKSASPTQTSKSTSPPSKQSASFITSPSQIKPHGKYVPPPTSSKQTLIKTPQTKPPPKEPPKVPPPATKTTKPAPLSTLKGIKDNSTSNSGQTSSLKTSQPISNQEKKLTYRLSTDSLPKTSSSPRILTDAPTPYKRGDTLHKCSYTPTSYTPKSPLSKSNAQQISDTSTTQGSLTSSTPTTRDRIKSLTTKSDSSLQKDVSKDKKDKKEDKKKRKKNDGNTADVAVEKPIQTSVIEENDFLRKYESYITDDDPESKIQFIPKNRKGEKIKGSELLMHTAELVFTEIMFCARLQIFKRYFEEVVIKEYSLRDYQEFLLFDPLDTLVDSVSRMCLELEPLYYELLEQPKNEEEAVLNIILKYYTYVNGGSVNLHTAYLPFVSHYTSLSNVINEFIENNKTLNKLIQTQMTNCIDKNIKQFADLYFAPTQRICRYELLLTSVLKEVKKGTKLENILSETNLSYKDMNLSINAYLFKSKNYFLKKYEYLDEIYKTNKAYRCREIVKETFCTPINFVSYHEGHKGAAIGSSKIELCIFTNGIFKRDLKKGFYNFYPILSVYKELSQKEEDAITENDIYFYDAEKKKSQIIAMGSPEERDQFNYSLKVTYDSYLKSENKSM
ncbi:DH domain-containing protein [Entamoeba marina]